MKILFCTNTFSNTTNGPSKFAQHLLLLNEHFPAIELHILTEDVTYVESNQYVHPIKLSIGKWTRPWGFIYRMFPYYQSCGALYARFPFDLVVFSNAITGIWAALFLRQPVIGMVNDDTNCSNSWSEFEFKREWFKRRLFYYFEKLACKLQAATIVNSNYLFSLLQINYKLKSQHIHLVYKGIPISSQKEIISKSLQSPINVIFVKTDYLRGGLAELINALSSLNNYHFKLQIIGPNPKALPEIREIPKSSNLEIDFIGPATATTVSASLVASDLFIVPSRKEALGVANMEALLAGIPVITTNVGGIPEVLDHGKNGWLVPPNDSKALADCIQMVIKNPEAAYQKQVIGREFVIANFSIEKSLNRFVDVLKAYCR